MNLLQNTTNDHENVLSETSANRPNINLFQHTTTDDEPVIQRQPTTPKQPSQLTNDTAESVQDILTNPPPPSENSTHSTPHNSPQQGSSNTFSIRQHPIHETQFHTNTTPIQSHQTLQYLPAQPSVSSKTSAILTINTLHTNPITNGTTSRNLSRPSLPLIQNNPLSYNLTSTNLHSQSFSNSIQSTNTNIQSSAINSLPHIPSTTTQTIPPIQPIHTQPQTNALNIPPTSFNPSTTHTIPPTTLPLSTLSTLTYINSATSISEPVKPFDGLDHNYTPEKYLQHIEARVTFSLGLQPTTVNEYKLWHARRMAFLQCSLTGTALSWHIRLNYTYKQDWNAFVQVLKNNFHHRKTLIMHKLKLLV